MRSGRQLCLLALSLALVALVVPSQSAILTVGEGMIYSSVSSALAAAQSGDEVVLSANFVVQDVRKCLI